LALQGNLEDLPLLDIIQIVSFSKKTGYLSIEMEGGDGAIVFLDGLVVAAFTATSPPADPRLGSLPMEARERAVRGRIAFALEQLARLREGGFAFELTDDAPAVVGSREIRPETLVRGINPQELLLDLAQGLDEDRAHSAAAVEASFAAPDEGIVAGEPIVPSESLPSDLRALEDEPPAPPSPQEWQTTTAESPGTDTRPLLHVARPGPPREPPASPAPSAEPSAAAVRDALSSSTTSRTRQILGGSSTPPGSASWRRGTRKRRRRPQEGSGPRRDPSCSSPTSECRPRAGPPSTGASRW
jgi:hypothetical protein